MHVKHDCGDNVPLVYGPTYLELEVLRPGREINGWGPLKRAFGMSGYCPHIIDSTRWQDPEVDFGDMEEDVIDTTVELAGPGEPAVIAGGSVHGLLGAFATMRMELYEPEEQRKLKFLGLSVSPFFQPFARFCINNAQGDLNAIPDFLRERVGRDTLFADEHRQEIVAGIPFPIVVSPSRLIVGSEELSHVQATCDFLCELWPRAIDTEVRGVGHDIMDDKYLDAIARQTSRLAKDKPLSGSSRDEMLERFGSITRRALAECGGVGGGIHTPFADFRANYLQVTAGWPDSHGLAAYVSKL